MDTQFKLLCHCLHITAKEAGVLVDRQPDTINNYMSGRRPTPPTIIESLERFVCVVDKVVKDYTITTESIDEKTLPAQLHKAVKLRRLSLDIIKKHLKYASH